jgi:hypothetical protein
MVFGKGGKHLLAKSNGFHVPVKYTLAWLFCVCQRLGLRWREAAFSVQALLQRDHISHRSRTWIWERGHKPVKIRSEAGSSGGIVPF